MTWLVTSLFHISKIYYWPTFTSIFHHIYYDFPIRVEIVVQASDWRLAFYSTTRSKPIKFLTVCCFTKMIMSVFVCFFYCISITVYFWPVNSLERVISNISTMKAGTRERWEISREDYFKGKEIVQVLSSQSTFSNL